MHRAKGDRLVCASMLPVCDNEQLVPILVAHTKRLNTSSERLKLEETKEDMQ